MVKKEKIREIRKVLDTHKMLTFNKFKNIVVKEKGLMAIGTFSDGLKEAVESRIITREEGYEGKRKVVRYSLPEIARKEDEYYDYLSNSITSFQTWFDPLERLFSELNNVEKGQILFSFLTWYYEMQSKIAMGHLLFHSSKFSDLSHFLVPFLQDLEKLSLSGDEKQQSIIWNELFMGWNDFEMGNTDAIDKLLGIAEAREAR